MATTGTANQTRRERWAARENQRRQDAFQRADLAWNDDRRLLDWMLATASSGIGFQPNQVGSDFSTKRGESLFGVFDGCKLVEITQGPGSYADGYSGFSFQASQRVRSRIFGSKGTVVPGPEKLRVLAEGEAFISNTRVTFQASFHNRDWAFSKLIAIQHDPTRPISIIHVSNRRKISGITYPPEMTARVRFALELGKELSSGSAEPLVTSLQTELAQHSALRPGPPTQLTPADAPTRAARIAAGAKALITGRPGRGAARRALHIALVGGAAVFLLSAGIGSFTAVTDDSPEPTLEATVASYTPSPSTDLAQTGSQSESPTAEPTATSATSPNATASHTTSPSSSPGVDADQPAKKVKTGPKPTLPRLLSTSGTPARVGATCRDGWHSDATGRGACSHHGGVRTWLYEVPSWVAENKVKNAAKIKAYKAALKKWRAGTARNVLLASYPCSGGPYKKGKPGYASWRDTNHNNIACDRGR